MFDELQRRVVCAALRESSGEIICSPRHFDPMMRNQIKLNLIPLVNWKIAEQGFVDKFGNFMTREEAMTVAVAAGQIVRSIPGNSGQLFSENLY